MRAAAYARVSTGKQDLEEIRQFVGRQGWTLIATYSDVASGAREDRTDFRRLLADAAKGKFEIVSSSSALTFPCPRPSAGQGRPLGEPSRAFRNPARPFGNGPRTLCVSLKAS